MAFKAPAYPDDLTNGSWQKNKGVIAKMAGETGIGDLLKKAETAYKAVAWDKFNLERAIPGQGKKRNPAAIKAAVDDAVAEGGKIKALDTALRDIEREAKKLAEEWKKDKKIPASSTKYALSVSESAKLFNFASTMGTLSEELRKQQKIEQDSYDTLMAENDKVFQKLKTNVDRFEADAKKTTLEEYGGFWSQNIRAIGTALPLIQQDHPELKAEWDIWKQFSNKQVKPTDEDAFKKQMAILVKVSHSLKPKLAQIN